MNIVFAGTPEFAAVILGSIIEKGHHISAAYCQPDRRVGRGKKLAFGPVKTLAIDKGIPVEQPVRFDQEVNEQGLTATQKLASYQPDLMIVVAYGLILPEEVLSVAKYGCINIHASLLPRWRGAAPIQRAIEYGDFETGITIMQMDKGLDTGNMLLKQSCKIDPFDTSSTLHDRLSQIACNAINQFLESFVRTPGDCLEGSLLSPGEIQDDQFATYAHKLSKAEAEINWSESAISIERKIRAFNAWPVSYTYVGKKRLRIWRATIYEQEMDQKEYQNGEIVSLDKKGIIVKCGESCIALENLQADGSRAMNAVELLNSKKQWFIDSPILG